MRAIQERHHLLQLVGWLNADLEPRLKAAWCAKAVRYNVLLKDFDAPPVHYKLIVEKFSNWREYALPRRNLENLDDEIVSLHQK
jgi:hypothetical protein